MAVAITSNMILVDAADVNTNWSTADDAYSGFQRQGSACLGAQASNGTYHNWASITSTDLSNSTIFVWMRSGNPTLESTGGFRIVVGDGTDRIAYYVGGSDNQGFSVLGWNLFKLNGANPPASFEVLAGSEANLTWTAITEVGVGFNYGSKAVGNSDNIFYDAIRYVNNDTPALTISGGTSGDRGTWSEITAADDSTTNAWGVIRRLVTGSDIYELNFGIEFGDDGTGSSYFDGSDSVVAINGINMTTGSMDIRFVGNSTGTNSFIMDNTTITNVGTLSNIDFTNANFDEIQLTNSQFANMGTFTFPIVDASKYVRGTIFNACGVVDISTTEFTNCNFVNSTSYSVDVDITTSGITSTAFDNPTIGAVRILTGGTFTFDDLTFTNTNGTTNYDIINAAGTGITVNAINGSNPVDTSGSTVTINNAVTLTLTGLVPNTEVRIYQAGTTTEEAGVENSSTAFTYTYNFPTGFNVDIRLVSINYDNIKLSDISLGSTPSTIPIQQTFDRWYNNP